MQNAIIINAKTARSRTLLTKITLLWFKLKMIVVLITLRQFSKKLRKVYIYVPWLSDA